MEKETYGGYMDYDTQWVSALVRAVYRKYIDLFPETVNTALEQSMKLSELLESYRD